MVRLSLLALVPSVGAMEVLPLNRIMPLNNMVDAMARSHRKKDFSEAVNENDKYEAPTSLCWKKASRRTGLVLLENPGAGLGEIEPYDEILKDGYMKIKCIKDSMYLYADKFGGNKHEYKVGDTQNVSIVHYNDHVPKEDRKEMTSDVCFNFCRTIPDMGYFGILNGRECYCEPHFKQLASDSSECDSVCEGDTTQMCGGKAKSNIFEMHFCNDAAQQLAAAAVTAYTVQDHLDALIPKAKDAANGKQDLAVELQKQFGQAGDPDASKLMQKAKVSAGKLLHLAEEAEEVRDALRSKIFDSVKLTGVNPAKVEYGDDVGQGDLVSVMKEVVPAKKAEKFMEFKTAKAGDDLTAALKDMTPKANGTKDELQNLYLLSEPMVSTEFYVHKGSCIVDDAGCISPRKDSDGNHFAGDWCWIEVLGGAKVQLEVEEWDLGTYTAHWGGNAYHWSTSGVYFYSPVKHTWDWFGANPTADMKHVWWASEPDLKEVHPTVDGYIGWWSWYWGQRKKGFKLCGKQDKVSEEERGIQYYPAMYFVDKEFKDVPMTCTGTMVEQPIYFKNYHGCAAACDARNQDCVGFAYFPTGNNKPNLCFLYSDFQTGQYYTGCGKKKAGKFLQIAANTSTDVDQPLDGEPQDPVCVAKLSKFVGTTLKPDKSGKCKQCFTTLTKADRCWN